MKSRANIRNPAINAVNNHPYTTSALLGMLFLYAAARFLQLFPDKIPMLTIVALHIIPVTIFALIHGARVYRWHGILTFTILCLVIGYIFEDLGVRTGFPLGRYYFTDLMGPKIWSVPVFLAIAYVGMGYLSWHLRR